MSKGAGVDQRKVNQVWDNLCLKNKAFKVNVDDHMNGHGLKGHPLKKSPNTQQ